MATYTKVYNNPYPDGWKDGKDGNTPVTADILNNQTETLESIEQYLEENPITQGVGSGETGTTDYNDLTNKPSINGTELSGDITLNIPTKTSDLENDSGFLTDIKEKSYNDLVDKPQINGIDLQGNLTVEELGLLDITESTDTTLENSKDGILKIKEIYGNTEQDTTSGKNLLNCNGLTTITDKGITVTHVYKNGMLQYVNVTGTATETASFYLSKEKSFTFTKDTKYIMSGCPTVSGVFMYLWQADKGTNRDYGNGVEISFTEDTSSSINIYIPSGTVCNNVKFYPMIRLATITDGTYEPFTDGASPNPDYPQEIESVVLSEIKTCGKNLFGFGKSAVDVTAELRPTYTQRLRLSSVDDDTNKIKCAFNGGNWSFGYVEIAGVDGTKDYAIRFDVESNTTEYTPTIRVITDYSDNSKLVLQIGGGNGTDVVANTEYFILSNIQIELGTIATEYEPYTESIATLPEPITLNGIGGVQDYVDAKRGVLVQKYKERIFNGSESGWAASGSVMGRFLFVSSGCAKDSVYAKSTQFTASKYSATLKKNNFFLSSEDSLGFDTGFSTLTEWKAHLANKPMTVVYELAEPIETPLPDADAEALKSLKTYDGVTHIFTDSEVEPDWLVEYNTTRVGTELDEIDAELAKINKRITDIGTTAQMNYSTEEQVVGTWIDGRSIYQKTITDVMSQVTDNVFLTHPIDTGVENLDFMVNSQVCVKQGDISILNTPYLTNAGLMIKHNYNVELNKLNVISNASAYSNAILYATIQYTKTTDTV